MSSLFNELTFGEKEGVPYFRMFINGTWVEPAGGDYFSVDNPFDGKVVAYVAKANIEDASHAVDAAFLAREKMKALAPAERAEILLKAAKLLEENQDEIIHRIVLEAGKPISDAKGEMKAAIKRISVGAEETKGLQGEALQGGTVSAEGKNKWAVVNQIPVGVVVGITPFNYPLFIPVSKIVPALAAGNTLVIKPASDDPTPMLFLANIFHEAGLPDGVFNVITGGGEAVGDYLVSHPKVNFVSFTGSTKIGHRIAEKAVMVKLHLELGGKSPSIVSKNADLDLAVKESVKGAIKFSGQRCDALSRILVEEPVYQEFITKTIEEVKKWVVGDPNDKATQLGPLINEAGFNKVKELVDEALDKGAKLEYGNKLESGKGLVVDPLVLSGVTTGMRIAWEETFGPVVTIMQVKDFNEAIQIANQSEYGLDASVFTQDLEEALYAARVIEAGTVQINGAPAHGVGDFPFGGDEESGIGREGIKLSTEEMSRLHTIVFNPKR